MNIGLIEDHPGLRDLFQTALHLSGHTTVVHECAWEAIQALLNARFENRPLPYDLLLIDLDCRALDHATLLARIRLFVPASALPILLLSGSHLVARGYLARPMAGLSWLPKPVSLENMLEEIQALLSRKSSIEPDDPPTEPLKPDPDADPDLDPEKG